MQKSWIQIETNRDFTSSSPWFNLVLGPIKLAAKFERLVNFRHDERVQDDDGHVGDELHDEELAPDGVEEAVVRVQPEGRLPDWRFVGVGKDVVFQLEKLKMWKRYWMGRRFESLSYDKEGVS